MKKELIKRLKLYLSDNELFRGNPATAAQIVQAEEQLGVAFDRDYSEFLSLFGGSYVGVPIYGFNNCAMLSRETVLDLTTRFRASYEPNQRWPLLARSYVISMTGTGDPVSINPRGKIVVFHHEQGEEEVLAGSFPELLAQNL